MRAVLITVGDEILLGQVVDTNAAWLGEHLALCGVNVRRSETVGDEEEAICEALDRAYQEGADLVVITGGLGPTQDDVTREAVAAFFGRSLEPNHELLAALHTRYERRGRTMPAAGRLMAEVPEGFEVIPNPLGTAPGLWGERVVEGSSQRVVMMPGVPHEMKAISEQSLFPRLNDLHPGAVLHKTLLTVGRGESEIAERLDGLTDLIGNGLSLAFLPDLGQVRVRLTSKGDEHGDASRKLDHAISVARAALGPLIFGEERESLPGVVQQLLVERGHFLALAESCTGGGIASLFTSISGASQAFVGAVVAYDNDIKERILGVPQEMLETHGAVSEPVAKAMAEGAVRVLRGTVGLSTTGIAGPTGGTEDKPVGTVWIACSHEGETTARLLRLTPNREINIGLTVSAGLDLVRQRLLRLP